MEDGGVVFSGSGTSFILGNVYPAVDKGASFSLRKVFSGPGDILQLGEDLQRIRGHPSAWGGSAEDEGASFNLGRVCSGS